MRHNSISVVKKKVKKEYNKMLSLIIYKLGFFSFTFILKILTFISIIIRKKSLKRN